MEEIKNPATPGSVTAPVAEPNAATPGTPGQVTPPSGETTPPATDKGAEGQNQEGTVTISTKEFGELQRNKARLSSIQKRNALKSKSGKEFVAGEDDDPEIVGELNREKEDHSNTKKDLLKAQVSTRVSVLLNKEEFARIPDSTKALILKNPASLSKADNLEEAMLDIEEFLTEQVAVLPPAVTPPSDQSAPGSSQTPDPAGHETPPNVASGGAAPADAAGMESVEGKTGSSRSKALIRNAIKTQMGGGKKV